jgi:hypothetical protein
MCFYVSVGVEFAEFGHLSGCRRNLLSDGEDLTWLPLLERKARPEALLSGAPGKDRARRSGRCCWATIGMTTS